ncbi:PREDICTED: translation initiation factor IF-2-like [Ficedula albicollis]|uniref:translation initiation factor IF-2-like n=1 Tax=Ficedula albicollis TaxID=59894 RepID=UPI0003594478|nr:PREDICTED: translation initiation factor IF-2-like [Ficedula albicollis]
MSLYCSFRFDYRKKKEGEKPVYKLDVIQGGPGPRWALPAVLWVLPPPPVTPRQLRGTRPALGTGPAPEDRGQPGRSGQLRLRHSGCEAGDSRCWRPPGASCAKERRGLRRGEKLHISPNGGVRARAGGVQAGGTLPTPSRRWERGCGGGRRCPGGTRPQVTCTPWALPHGPLPPPVADKPETALSLSWTPRPGPAALETGVFGKNKKNKK